MIVVVGLPLYRHTNAGPTAGGTAAGIALVATRAGSAVQVVGKIGEDDAGEAVVLALARQGVGHVAMLREAGRPTARARDVDDDSIDTESPVAEALDERPTLDAADVDLALRYLTDFAVLVLVEQADGAIAQVVADAANWVGARLIVVVPAAGAVPDGLQADAIVFEAPDADPDGVFATMVGAFAAALDEGDDPGDAFRTTVAQTGWAAIPDEPAEVDA